MDNLRIFSTNSLRTFLQWNLFAIGRDIERNFESIAKFFQFFTCVAGVVMPGVEFHEELLARAWVAGGSKL